MKNQTSVNRRGFIRRASKIVQEWNGHLEIFSLPQAIENSRQYLLLRTDILQKTVVGCRWDIRDLSIRGRGLLRARDLTSTFFAYSQNIDFPESFILPYFTRKVSTVIFSEGG